MSANGKEHPIRGVQHLDGDTAAPGETHNLTVAENSPGFAGAENRPSPARTCYRPRSKISISFHSQASLSHL